MSDTPSARVIAAMERGVVSRTALADATGLSPDLVDLILDHLQATGDITRSTLESCPAGSCGDCQVASGCATQEHGTRAPVLLTLRRRPS